MAMQIHSGVGNRLGGRPSVRRYVRKGLMSEINVTPFVDVMLVLLIVFMVTAPLLTSGVKVDLPDTKNAPLAGQDEPLTVTVTEKKRIYIEKTLIDLKSLGAKLSSISEQKKDTRIFVRGDKSVDYGYIMQIVTAINDAGFTKVGLVTENIEN